MRARLAILWPWRIAKTGLSGSVSLFLASSSDASRLSSSKEAPEELSVLGP